MKLMMGNYKLYVPGKNLSLWINALAYTLLLIFLLCGAVLTYKAFTEAALAPDSGYYLTVGLRIANGWIPFSDLYLEYPPLGFYFYALPALAGFANKIETFYFINYLFIIAGSYLVYVISKILTNNTLLSSLAGIMTLPLTLYCQGYNSLLEPFTVFFYLLAIVSFLKGLKSNRSILFVIAGVLLFLSFFSKQYGLLVLPPLFLYSLIIPNSSVVKVKVNTLTFIGFSICALVIFAYFSFYGVSPVALLKSLVGGGKGTNTYGAQSLMHMFEGVITYSVRLELFIFVIPLLLLFNNKIRRDPNFILLLGLNLCAFLPLYFASFTHYFQLIVPFSVLLGVYILKTVIDDMGNKTVSYLSSAAVLASFSFSALLLVKILLQFDQTNYKYSRAEQLENAAAVMQLVPKGSQVLMAGSEEMYFLCDYEPVKARKYGYMFHGWFAPHEAVSLIDEGQYLIVDKAFFENYKDVVSGLKLIGVVDELNIYTKI